MSMNLLWRLLLNFPALSLIALPFLFAPLQSFHLLSWFLPVAMPAVVKTPHRGPITCQKQPLPFSPAIHAKIFKINQCFIIQLPCLKWSCGSWTARIKFKNEQKPPSSRDYSSLYLFWEKIAYLYVH